MSRGNWGKQPGGVQDESHFRGNVNEGSEKGVQKSERGQAHPDAVNDQRSDKVLHDRAAAAPRDRESFDKLREIIANEDDVRTFSRNVRAGTHRNSNGSLHQSRSVVDSISYHNDVVPSLSQLADKFQLLLRQKFSGDFIDISFPPMSLATALESPVRRTVFNPIDLRSAIAFVASGRSVSP
jgi:hypothetical protein